MKKLYYLIILFLLSNFGFSQVTDSFLTKTSDFKIGAKNEYTIVENLFNSNYTSQEGAPQLPVFSRSYVLPAGSIVSGVSYSNGSKTEMSSNYFIYPSQPPCPLNGEPCPDFVQPDPAIYNSANPFPTQTGTIVSDATIFGYHVVKLEICPFEYIPSQKKLFYYNQINISIQYSIGQVEYTKRITERRNQIARDFVQSSVQNQTTIENSYKIANQIVTNVNNTDKLHIHWKPSSYGEMPDYIIITNQSLKSKFDDLANYKIQRGVPTVVVTVEQIYENYAGCDNPEKIRNYLKDAYNFWGAGLFVLLGGDTEVIPGRVGIEYSSRVHNYTDMYYCDVYKPNEPNYNWNSNGDSNFGFNNDICELGPDNFIGRAPIHNLQEAQNFITKVTAYENLTGVSNTSYVNNMLFLGSYHGYNHDTNTGTGISFGGQRWHHLLSNKVFYKHKLRF